MSPTMNPSHGVQIARPSVTLCLSTVTYYVPMYRTVLGVLEPN
jgi:hypothetical protein